MKPTNYHLFDFLDFDTELLRDESLWKPVNRQPFTKRMGISVSRSPFKNSC